MQKLTLLVVLMAVLVLAASVRTEEEEVRPAMKKRWNRWRDWYVKPNPIDWRNLPRRWRESWGKRNVPIDVVEIEDNTE